MPNTPPIPALDGQQLGPRRQTDDVAHPANTDDPDGQSHMPKEAKVVANSAKMHARILLAVRAGRIALVFQLS